jgi:hypothetical protein
MVSLSPGSFEALVKLCHVSGNAPACLWRSSGKVFFFFPVVVLQRNSSVDHVESDRCC